MEPRLTAGDIAVSRPVQAAELHLGQVLLVSDPDHPGRLRLHRLVDVRDGQLVLAGDANPSADSSTVAPSAVRGVGALRIPALGLPVVRWAAGDPLPAAIAGAGLVGLLAVLALTRPAGWPGGVVDRPRVAAPLVLRRRRRPNARRLALLVTLVAGISVLEVATPARAVYARTATTSGNSLSANAYYTCVNSTYDGSTATPGSGRALRAYALQDATAAAVNSGTQTSSNGTYVGTPTYTASGRPTCGSGGTRAVTFNGSSQFLNTTIALSPALSTTTVEVWFKTTDVNGGQLIGVADTSQTSVGSTTADRLLYLTAAGKVAFGVLSGATKTAVVSPLSYNDGAWHLATGTLSATGTMLYVDGTQVGGTLTTTTSATAPAATGFPRMAFDSLTGWPSAPTNFYLAGSLAHGSIFPVAMSATKVLAHYRAGS
jgi:hypothetical protein